MFKKKNLSLLDFLDFFYSEGHTCGILPMIKGSTSQIM
jgi:hypothetical protein